MNRRFLTVLTALVILVSAKSAMAQEIMLEGPLAGAPACRNCTLFRHGRVSIAPIFSFSLLDDYRRHIFLGGRVQYNITDWIALSVSGGASGFWSHLLDTGLTDEVSTKAPNGIDSNRANFPFDSSADGNTSAMNNTTELLGRIQGFVSFEVAFIPFRGKLGLFSRLFLDVDLYVYAGYAIPFVDERADVDCRTAEYIESHEGGRIPGGVSPDDWDAGFNDRCPWITSGDDVPRSGTRVAVGAGTYGLGVSIYANNWLSILLEYRVMPFKWNHTGTDERGMMLVNNELTFCPSDASEGDGDYCGETGEFPDHRINANDRTWVVNHQFNFGVAFHFPLTPRRSE